MNNKVLVRLILPELSTDFDIFIPVDEIVWRVKKLCIKAISNIINVNINSDFILFNANSGTVYHNNDFIIDTDIRNATELVMISIN